MDLSARLRALTRSRIKRGVDGFDWEYINLLFEGTTIAELPDLVIETIISKLPCKSRIELFREEGVVPCFSVQNALELGHIDCLRNYEDVDWSKVQLTKAATYGRFEVLEYAYKKGAKVYQYDIDALNISHNQCIKYEIEGCDHQRCIDMYADLERDTVTAEPTDSGTTDALLFNLESD
jgi:hypothetical protein